MTYSCLCNVLSGEKRVSCWSKERVSEAKVSRGFCDDKE